MKKTVFLIILFFMCAQIAGAQDVDVDGDLLVQGSECVGSTDCPASPTTFFDTASFDKINLWVDGDAPHDPYARWGSDS